MPKFDGTGPQGQGPMTGRGMGPCAMPIGRQGSGYGYGRGYGMGFGRTAMMGYGRFGGCPLCGAGMNSRNWMTKEERKQMLEEEAKDLEAELKGVKEAINEEGR